MRIRKIALLSTIVGLCCIWIAQGILAGSASVRVSQLTDKPDTLVINRADNSVLSLTRSGDNWLVGDQKYPADMAVVNPMLQAINSIKILGTVSGSGDYERYGLPETGGLIVSALKDGHIIRHLIIGKNSVTAQQSYVRLGDDKSVLLVSGNFRDTFDKTLANLRDTTIWSVPSDSITSVSWTELATAAPGKSQNHWQIVKSGNPPVWSLTKSPTGVAVDEKKLAAWIDSLAMVKAESFAEEKLALPSDVLGSVSLEAGGKSHSLTLFKKTVDNRYLCTASGLSSVFYVTAYTAQNLLKAIKELQK